MKSSRVNGIDLLRGAAILLMVIYHGLFSLVYIFGVELDWFHSPLFNDLGAPLLGGTFVLISGISSRFSRSSLKRGVQVFFWALVMTAATALVVPDLTIRFGILHLLGCCMILGALLRPWLDKIPRRVGLGISLALFALTYNVPRGYLGFRSLAYLPLRTENPYLFPFGLITAGFSSSDFYPLMPWFFLFLAGIYLGSWIQEGKGPEWLYPSHLPWLEAVGRHTLWIYVLHQPVMIALFWLWFQLFPLK